jgi:hypothetical protein
MKIPEGWAMEMLARIGASAIAGKGVSSADILEKFLQNRYSLGLHTPNYLQCLRAIRRRTKYNLTASWRSSKGPGGGFDPTNNLCIYSWRSRLLV